MRARKQLLALGLMLCGLGAPACGATHAATSTQIRSGPAPSTTLTSPAVTKPAGPPHRSSRSSSLPRLPRLPRLGTSRRVPAPGTTLVVTIRTLIDPLRGSGAQVLAGTRPVALLVAVQNVGPGGYDSSTTGDFSLNTAAGKAPPLFVPHGVCQTPLRDFMNAIAAGQLRTGCIAFSIPDGQRPTTVAFAADGGSSGRRRVWSVG